MSVWRLANRDDRIKDTDIHEAWPPAKKQLTIRLDEDVLDWLKRHGKAYQTRINRILRVVMESQPPRTAHR